MEAVKARFRDFILTKKVDDAKNSFTVDVWETLIISRQRKNAELLVNNKIYGIYEDLAKCILCDKKWKSNGHKKS